MCRVLWCLVLVFPTYVARTFISGPTRDALIGDLAEAFAAGRSRRWYWRQAVVAIAASAARVVREHKALTLRALVTGWVAYVLTAFVANALTVETRDNVLGWLAAAGVDSADPSSLLFQLVLLAGRPLAALIGGMAGVGTNFEPSRRA